MVITYTATNTKRLKDLKRKRLRIFWYKVLFVFIGLLVLFGASVLIMRIDKLKITKVTIEGNHVVQSEDIQKKINEELSGNYLFFFPKRNGLLYPRHTIRNDLQETFPRFDQVVVTRENINEIKIVVVERESVYLWCGMHVRNFTDADNPCYYVDEQGYIFSKAPYFSGTIYFKFFGSNIALPDDNPIGKYVLPSNVWGQVVLLKDDIESLGFAPHSLAIYDKGEYSFLLSSIPEDTRLRIVFSDKYDLKKIGANLASALTVEPLKTDIQTKFTSLEYIDLRYENKVYYKFTKE